MDLGLKGCKAFIAGASRGLGKACAKALTDEGARVFVCSRNAEELKRAAADVGAAGFSAADVSRPAEVKRIVAEAIATLGGLDCLVSSPMPAVRRPLPLRRPATATGISPTSSI